MNTPSETKKYVIKYTLNGQRRFEFVQLSQKCDEEARAKLERMHAPEDKITDVKVSTPL